MYIYKKYYEGNCNGHLKDRPEGNLEKTRREGIQNQHFQRPSRHHLHGFKILRLFAEKIQKNAILLLQLQRLARENKYTGGRGRGGGGATMSDKQKYKVQKRHDSTAVLRQRHFTFRLNRFFRTTGLSLKRLYSWKPVFGDRFT